MIQLYLWVSPKYCRIKRFEEIYCRWIKILVQGVLVQRELEISDV